MTPATKPTLSKHQSHPLTQSIRSASAMRVEHSHTAAPGGQTMSEFKTGRCPQTIAADALVEAIAAYKAAGNSLKSFQSTAENAWAMTPAKSEAQPDV